jgi:hypothetical protein
MVRVIPLLLLFLLTGCGQNLHFKISYNDIESLAEGDSVVLDGQPIGKVTGVESTQQGKHLVEVAIPRKSATAATHEASFVLAPDPDNPARRRIEVVLARPGGKPIADDEIITGSYPGPLFSFGQLLRGFGDALHDLTEQANQFRQEFQKLPNSPEAQQLQDEWRKLTDEINKAQNEAGDTVKNEVLPKLEKQLEDLRKQLKGMQGAEPKKDKALGI